jgi:hypothetical protein
MVVSVLKVMLYNSWQKHTTRWTAKNRLSSMLSRIKFVRASRTKPMHWFSVCEQIGGLFVRTTRYEHFSNGVRKVTSTIHAVQGARHTRKLFGTEWAKPTIDL